MTYAEAFMKWTSCEDELPKGGEKVLAYNDGAIAEAYHYGKDGWDSDSRMFASGITHWMPLPPPPSK